MSGYYLANNPNADIKALVAIGAPAIQFDDGERDFAKSISSIQVPILDIYGSQDLQNVLNGADTKVKAARKSGNKRYNQVKIDGANHFFVGKSDELVKRVRGWLKTNATGK
jgi:alpha/beta superfamily hydrolase